MTTEQAKLLVQQFEGHTLPKEQWTHEAHFITAFWYCVHFPLPQAVQKIRDGIKTYNISVGGQNTDTAGYHETITLLNTGLIARFIITHCITKVNDKAIINLLQQPFINREYPLQFYTKELLHSTRARLAWVDGDIKC